MVTKVVPVETGKIITRGSVFTFNFTLTKDAALYAITGFTPTSDIWQDGGSAAIVGLTDHVVTIVDGAAGTVTIVLTAAETLLLVAPTTELHLDVGDMPDRPQVYEGSSVFTYCGPFVFHSRNALT